MATPTVSAPQAASKYDRQLRLWGASGQEKLATARVALLHASAVGAEALKNLVLPGVGSFTVIDPYRVTADDLQSNFFLTGECLGQHRALVMRDLLQELNEDVKGDALVADPATLQPSALLGYTLVIATQMTAQQLAPIAATLYSAGIPLVTLNCVGFLGSVRCALPTHTIVESRVARATEDLRVTDPFPTLRAFVDSFELSALDDMAHAHVPWVVLVVKALDAWKAAHGGALPANEKEKKEVRDILTRMARRLPGGGGSQGLSSAAAAAAAAEAGRGTASEENFEEALEQLGPALRAAAGMPEDVSEVLSDPVLSGPPSPSWAPFWFVARAIADFAAGEGGGRLPLSGALPDMTATTEAYVALQGLYREKAAADAEAVRARVWGLCDAAGVPASHVPEVLISSACRSPFTLKVLRLRSLAQEAACDGEHKAALQEALEEASYDPSTAASCPALWYLAMRAADAFTNAHGRRPGSNAGRGPGGLSPAQLETDIAELSRLFTQVLVERELAAASGSSSGEGGGAALAAELGPKLAAELCRYGGGELAVTAAFCGAVGSQEAIKLVTAQFVPLNNTFVYNGITGASAVYCL